MAAYSEVLADLPASRKRLSNPPPKEMSFLFYPHLSTTLMFITLSIADVMKNEKAGARTASVKRQDRYIPRSLGVDSNRYCAV